MTIRYVTFIDFQYLFKFYALTNTYTHTCISLLSKALH